MGSTTERGRSRITMMLLLGLGIALLGALLLPRLLNEAHPPEPRTSQATICFVVAGDATGLGSGRGRLSLVRPGQPPLRIALDVEPGQPATQMAEAAADALRGAATHAGWSAPPVLVAADNCLHLEDVVEIGGDPGIAGLGVSYSLAVGGAQGGAIRLALARAGGKEPGCRGTVGITARRAATDRSPGATAATLRVGFTGTTTRAGILRALEERLGEAGWAYAREGEALVIRGLPDGGAVGGLLLAVQYDEVPPDPGAALTWTLSMVR